jgi:Carboxypeptidase regulatory-like domain
MIRILEALVLLTVATIAAGCDAFVSAKGRVTDASGRPLQGAKVQLAWGEHVESADTDSLGNFALSFAHGVSKSKEGHVSVCKAGYAVQRVDFAASDTALDALTFRLLPGLSGGGNPLCR